ncbi:branched-chain amino acid transport system substrate-binding protein [Bradyrhizobium sp. USDA 4518]
MLSRAGAGLCILLSMICGPCDAVDAAKASGQSVRIGVLTDMSGTYANASGTGAVEAARMAVEDFGGRVFGAPIELVVADHKDKADVALAKAREWYGVGGVNAIFGLTTSSVAIAVFEATKEQRKIAVAAGAVSSDLTGMFCSPYGVQWAYDTSALAIGTGSTAAPSGRKSWFFVTLDSPLGRSIESDTARMVAAAGGSVVGTMRFPTASTTDYWPLLLRARQSNADVVALAAGADGVTSFARQAHEFDLAEGRHQRLASLLPQLTDVDAMGLKVAQGMVLTDAFYWDRTDQSRAWSKRFFERRHRMPTTMQASVYSSISHYLAAVAAAGSVEANAVMRKMREMPIHDMFADNGRIAPDGRMMHDMYVMQVKTPQESGYPWDYYKILKTIPSGQAFPSRVEGQCPLLRGPERPPDIGG